MSGSVKWKLTEPSALTHPIALSKTSTNPTSWSRRIGADEAVGLELTATNTSSEDAYSFKVKTTNPKRYCVRPNVGVIWAGKDARVAVSCTPAVREAPPDVNKCKDKFWVLMLKLSAETASSLAEADAEAQRKILADLWGSDAAKEATVDKVRVPLASSQAAQPMQHITNRPGMPHAYTMPPPTLQPMPLLPGQPSLALHQMSMPPALMPGLAVPFTAPLTAPSANAPASESERLPPPFTPSPFTAAAHPLLPQQPPPPPLHQPPPTFLQQQQPPLHQQLPTFLQQQQPPLHQQAYPFLQQQPPLPPLVPQPPAPLLAQPPPPLVQQQAPPLLAQPPPPPFLFAAADVERSAATAAAAAAAAPRCCAALPGTLLGADSRSAIGGAGGGVGGVGGVGDVGGAERRRVCAVMC